MENVRKEILYVEPLIQQMGHVNLVFKGIRLLGILARLQFKLLIIGLMTPTALSIWVLTVFSVVRDIISIRQLGLVCY